MILVTEQPVVQVHVYMKMYKCTFKCPVMDSMIYINIKALNCWAMKLYSSVGEIAKTDVSETGWIIQNMSICILQVTQECSF